MSDMKIVLCGANAYDEKYFFNPEFSLIPRPVQEELRVIAVLFTREVGGIFLMGFDGGGELQLETRAAPEDLLYDEIGSGLLLKKVRESRVELFGSLELFYRAVVLKEAVD